MIAFSNPVSGDDLTQTIYINGERRLCSGIGIKFYVDAEGFEGKRCSMHGLSEASVLVLKQGGLVKSNGNWYSLKPHRWNRSE